jgi:hypothetical protein
MNSQNNIDFIPKLDKPGAGIPLTNRLFLRFFIKPFIAKRTPWKTCEKMFLQISEKILRETQSLTDEQLSKKIVVPPMRGLEDSSRYWSVAMAIEHLVIVGKKMHFAISELSQGRLVQEIADTAKVKPLGEMPPAQAIHDFRQFVEKDFPALEKFVSQKDSPLEHIHPWFGPMSARQWYWLLGVHQNIHLQQIREIKKFL